MASFYRTSAGAEIDLVLGLPGKERWVMEIKRSLSARPEKGFYLASEDIKATRPNMVLTGHHQAPTRSAPPPGRQVNAFVATR